MDGITILIAVGIIFLTIIGFIFFFLYRKETKPLERIIKEMKKQNDSMKAQAENLRERCFLDISSFHKDIKRIAKTGIKNERDILIVNKCLNFVSGEIYLWRNKRKEQEKDLKVFLPE